MKPKKTNQLKKKTILIALILGFICLQLNMLNVTNNNPSISIQIEKDEINPAVNDLISNVTLTIKTDNESYNKGQNIKIFGNINSTNPATLSSKVNISLHYGEWKRQISTTIKNNSYEQNYNISYGDPKGIWNITVEIIDINGNLFSKSKDITINLPQDIVRYNVILFSPPKDAVYIRGNTLNISVLITENGIGVNNALIKCYLSSEEIINLTEINDGYYQISYKIPWNSKTDLWSISLESIKTVGNSLRVGGSYTIIEIKPAILNLDLIEPVKNKYNVGELINIELDLHYPDGSIVENATVIAKTPKGNITLITKGNATYDVNFSISDNKKGSWFIEIFATDQFGNNASITKIVYIMYEEKFLLSSTAMLGLIGLGIFSMIAFYIFRKRYSAQHLSDIQAEIKEVKRLQNETAIFYYKKGTISREIYNVLRQEHAKRLTELQKEERKLNRNINENEMEEKK
jgi:hypothetical protein